MEFASVNGIKRPVRCCEETRLFAWESLGHKYGKQTWETQYVDISGVFGIGEMSPTGRYDAAIRKIAEEAPLRICENELLSGAATLGAAISHLVPAKYADPLNTPLEIEIPEKGDKNITITLED